MSYFFEHVRSTHSSRSSLLGNVDDVGIISLLDVFEARASPGGVIRDDEILEEARATRGDERPKSQQRRPPSPSWILLDEKSEKFEDKAAFLVTCKNYLYASEINTS